VVNPNAQADPGLLRLIHEGFAHRRKTLKKNLLMAGYPAPAVAEVLATAQLDPRVRAEALALESFYMLRESLQKFR
jgi:16S rRNA (adenine1518-N6/adenine1519-N6)-dimethyltransferase